jgi:hypothetical protein
MEEVSNSALLRRTKKVYLDSTIQLLRARNVVQARRRSIT